MENLVGFVKRSFFKVRRFQDAQDREQELGEWHREEVNEERPCGATEAIPTGTVGREGAAPASF